MKEFFKFLVSKVELKKALALVAATIVAKYNALSKKIDELTATDIAVTDTAGNFDATTKNVETILAELAGKVKSWKDKVVSGGAGVVVKNGKVIKKNGQTLETPEDATGVADGTYLRLTIENSDDPVWIEGTQLVDVYTAAQNAAKVQLAITEDGVISASILAGSIEKTDLVTAVQTSLGKADTAIQSDDLEAITVSDVETMWGEVLAAAEAPAGNG